MSEFRKEIGVAVAIAVVLAVLVGGMAIYLFPTHDSGSLGVPRAQVYPIYATALTCGVGNGSCRIVIFNDGELNAQAVGCDFQSTYAVNGNNQSITTVDRGTGVLSNESGGGAMSIAIPAGASVPVFCTVGTQSSYVKVGSEAGGEVLFTNQTLNVQFWGTWQ